MGLGSNISHHQIQTNVRERYHTAYVGGKAQKSKAQLSSSHRVNLRYGTDRISLG